jgi:hypothetical protein
MTTTTATTATASTPAAPGGATLLAQYLVLCPGCGRSAAVHVDEAVARAPVLVRFVCPLGCGVDDTSVLQHITTGRASGRI